MIGTASATAQAAARWRSRSSSRRWRSRRPQDIRALKLLPLSQARSAGRRPAKLAPRWTSCAAGARPARHRRDLDKDGATTTTRRSTLMDAWWPSCSRPSSSPRSGADAYKRLQGMLRRRASAAAADRARLLRRLVRLRHKDLRDVFDTRKPRAPQPRLLRRRLEEGVPRGCCSRRCSTRSATPQKLYGARRLRRQPAAACYDQDRSRSPARSPRFHSRTGRRSSRPSS